MTHNAGQTMTTALQGIDAATGAALQLAFGPTIVDATRGVGAGGRYLAPGWIDIQVNGFAGVDYNSPTVSLEEIARSLQVQFSTGVTRLYPTVITGSPASMRASLANLARAKDAVPHGEAIEGFHVEGPHISPDDGPRGAHPRHWVRPPDLEEFRAWQDAAHGYIRLVTVAPEWPQAPAYIESLTGSGVAVAIGHTNATAAQIADAVSAGAVLSTHLGNGAHAILPRHPNYIWEQLAEDRLAASFIADGIHLPASFLKPAVAAKGILRSVLVTDASTPAGAPPGRYPLGEQWVDLTPDHRVVLAGQDKLAGSALRMHHAVQNVIRLAGVALKDAVTMATTNPARVCGIPGRRGGLVPGDRADIVVFGYDAESGEVHVEATYLSGVRVWDSQGAGQ
ncbi:MAG: amidohydrolase family protein [Rhizomicrobium sp.]